MTGATRHVQIPADDPAFLRRLAGLLDNDPSRPDPRYAERCRAAADKLEGGLPEITAASVLEDLVPHGVLKRDISYYKREGMTTVGELCERNAADLGDIAGIGQGSLQTLSFILAKFNMGLRP